MLFLWSREPSASSSSPRAGPWFAWFATAVLLWRCRRRIARVLAGAGSVLQLGLLRRRRSPPQRTASLVVSKAHHHKHRHRHRRLEHQHRRQRSRTPSSASTTATEARRRHLSSHQLHPHPHPVCQAQQQQQHIGDRPAPRVQQPRLKVRKRPKIRANPTGAEGPRRLGVSASCVQISQQLYCRVTRSGRVYGRYPTKPPPIK